jgi:nucleoside-diphosphate-sugar epimerase
LKVLVTGAGGYLGSCVTAELLESRHTVVAVDSLIFGEEGITPFHGNPRFHFAREDLSTIPRQRLADLVSGCDAVVHLAAIVGEALCSQYPDLAIASNREATKLVVMACKNSSVNKFIFASTCSNYGSQKQSSFVDETSEVTPTSLYSQTKIESEKIVLNGSRGSFEPSILRFATLCGVSAMMRFDLLLNELVRDAFVLHTLKIVKPDAWRPFLNVRDAANAVCQFLELKDASGIFNVGLDSNNITKQDLATLISRKVEKVMVETLAGGSTERNYRVSFSKIRNTIDTVRWKSLEDNVVEVRDALGSGVVRPDDGDHRLIR